MDQGFPKGKEGKGKESGVRKCEEVKATSWRRGREVVKWKGRRDWVSEPFHSSWMFQPSPLSQTGREERAVTTEAVTPPSRLGSQKQQIWWEGEGFVVGNVESKHLRSEVSNWPVGHNLKGKSKVIRTLTF